MSFILDALKKSETERQRQDAPGIASIPEGDKARRSGKWVWLIAGLLVINLAVLAGIFWSRGEAVREPVTTAAPSEAPAGPASATAVTESSSGSLPSATGSVTTQADVTAAPAPAPPPTVTAGLPTFNELRANGELQLPDMHLDIHVYSGQPADRFVFVNMSKYKENATLSEGPLVREITPDGVVLDFQGRQFLLPRE